MTSSSGLQPSGAGWLGIHTLLLFGLSDKALRLRLREFYIAFFREIGVPKFADTLQPELLRIRQGDREWTPPKIARGPIIN